MKAIKLSVLTVAAAMSISVFAQTAQAQTQVQQGKTREQVHQELVKAQHDGVVPVSKTQYPPSATLIAQNKETHAAARHKGEKSPAMDQHDASNGR